MEVSDLPPPLVFLPPSFPSASEGSGLSLLGFNLQGLSQVVALWVYFGKSYQFFNVNIKWLIRLHQVTHTLNEEGREQGGSGRKPEKADATKTLPRKVTMAGPLSQDTSEHCHLVAVPGNSPLPFFTPNVQKLTWGYLFKVGVIWLAITWCIKGPNPMSPWGCGGWW